MHKILLNLLPQQLQRLREISAATNIPINALIRRAIDIWLEEYGEFTLTALKRKT